MSPTTLPFPQVPDHAWKFAFSIVCSSFFAIFSGAASRMGSTMRGSIRAEITGEKQVEKQDPRTPVL